MLNVEQRAEEQPSAEWLIYEQPLNERVRIFLRLEFLLEQAAQLDMTVFEARYRADGQGGVPYDPRMMCSLLLYCYCKGARSSREIEMATYDDVGARVICCGEHPDHASVARFVVRHEEEIRGLLPQSVTACAREGLVRVDVVAGDGTKLKASASMDATVTVAKLEEQIADLEALAAGTLAVAVLAVIRRPVSS